jgi:tetratricopeptide (TPR) repeat protein
MMAGRLCLLAAFLLAAPERARANPPEMQPQARALLEEGLRYYDLRDYEEAVKVLRRALEVERRPEIWYAMAQAQRMAGDCAGAIPSYEAFLETGPPAGQADATRKNIERCRAELRARPLTPPEPPNPTAPALSPTLAPHRPPWYADPIGDALCIGGLAALGGGVTLWKIGRDDVEDANSARSYADYRRHAGGVDTAETEQAVGVAAMAVGGALIVAGIARYWWRPAARADRPAIAGALVPGGGLVVLSGRAF